MPNRTAGPQPGDGFVPVADPGGPVLRPEVIRRGAAPILVWLKDRKTGLVRDGARFNQVLLLRVLDDAVNERTDKLVAFSAIFPMQRASCQDGRRKPAACVVRATGLNTIRCEVGRSWQGPPRYRYRRCLCGSMMGRSQ